MISLDEFSLDQPGARRSDILQNVAPELHDVGNSVDREVTLKADVATPLAIGAISAKLT